MTKLVLKNIRNVIPAWSPDPVQTTVHFNTFPYCPVSRHGWDWKIFTTLSWAIYIKRWMKGLLIQPHLDRVIYLKMSNDEKLIRNLSQSLALGAMKHSFTILPFCDGFHTYAKKRYNCCPILAMNYNLHPSLRVFADNYIPLSFISGPQETIRLGDFCIVLLEKIEEINANVGASLRFYDGLFRNVRVHVPMITGYSPARAKTAGTTGSNRKHPCLQCEIREILQPFKILLFSR